MPRAGQETCPGCSDQTWCPQPPPPGPTGSRAQGGGSRGHGALRAEPGRVTAPASVKKGPHSPGMWTLNLPLCPKALSMTPSSPVDRCTLSPTNSWILVSFLNRERPITLWSSSTCAHPPGESVSTRGRLAATRTCAQTGPPASPPAGIRRADGSPQPSRPPILEPIAPQEGQGGAVHSRAHPARALATSQPRPPASSILQPLQRRGKGCVCVQAPALPGLGVPGTPPPALWAPGMAWAAHGGGPCGRWGPPPGAS